MNPIIRNILAWIAGAIIGMAVNMGLVMLGPTIIAPPEGVNQTTLEGLKSSMELLEFKHFIFPWLAHALGTLAGAIVACLLGASHYKLLVALIGLLFFIGGFAMVLQVPPPTWFAVVDLALAYFPMAWLGKRMIRG